MNCRIILAICISLSCLLSSCNYVDDYMLGKDNSLSPTPLQPLKAKWEFKPLWSNPISGKQVSGHLRLVPQLSQQTIYVATTDGIIAAVDSKGGNFRWRKQYPHGFTSGPAIKNNVLALGTANNELSIVNQKNGTKLWQQSLSSELMAPPLLFADNVITKTMDGTVVAFSLNQGKKLWTVEHGSPQLILKASAGPIIMNTLILVPFSDGKVSAIDPKSGRIAWEHEMVYATGASDVERLVDIDADLLVSGNVFYVASFQGELGAFSPAQGDFLWRKSIATFHNMVMDSQALFVVDNNSVVWAIDRHNGHVLWKQSNLKGRKLTAPALMGNRLLVADKEGFLHGLSTTTGEIEARLAIKSPIEVTPVVYGKRVYIMTLSGELKAFAVQSI